jgi:two-component system catabolic regulation response regulator CreB
VRRVTAVAETVLLVEDEPAIADTVAYALRSQGFEVRMASTGDDAVELLRAERVHCVLLDIGLPDVNGLELCKEIRVWSSVPVIFVTARSEEVDRVVGLEIGADDYVVKPFSPRELTARVKAVLRRTTAVSQPEEPATPGSPFTVDEQRKRISYFGAPLPLSRYEFRVLAALVERPGWVFSRGQLMERAWEEPTASMTRTVDTHIKTIRAKLRRVRPDCDPIRTHRGLGYSLSDPCPAE